MTKDWYSGAATIPDTQDNIVFQEQKSRIAIANTSAMAPPIMATLSYSGGSGIILPELASTDLHLVADDLTSGSDWVSRIGGFTATATGLPTVGVETPYYPSGGFSGVGYRTAVGDFSATKYYQLAYNAAHAITAASTVTYEFVIKSGVLATEETIFSRYITGSANYNFRLYMKNDGAGNYTVYGQVGATSIKAPVITQGAYTHVAFTYNGPTASLIVYVAGVSVGSGGGTIINNTTAPVYIGTSDPAIGFPCVNSQILEVVRHQTVLTATQLLQRFQKSFGLEASTPGGDVYPTTYAHNSKNAVEVNGKIWALGHYVPAINEKGLFVDSPRQSGVGNSAITDGDSLIVRSANTTRITESGSFNYFAGGQTITIPLNGLAESSMWYESGIAGPKNSCVAFVWRPVGNAGTKAYGYIYNFISAKYYTPGAGTWGAAPYVIDLTSYIVRGSGTFASPYVSSVPFTTETYGGTNQIQFTVHNNSVLDLTSSIYVYLVQNDENGQLYTPPLAIVRPTGGDGVSTTSTNLIYTSGIINWNKGRITFSLYPVYSSTYPTATAVPPSMSNVGHLGGSTGTHFLNMNFDSAVFRMHDAAGNVITLSPTFSSYERLDFQLDWSNLTNTMSMAILNKGLFVSGVFTAPLDSGNFRFGIASQTPQGFIKNLIIR